MAGEKLGIMGNAAAAGRARAARGSFSGGAERAKRAAMRTAVIALMAGVAMALTAVGAPQSAHAQAGAGSSNQPAAGVGASGLPLPRFVSLKSDRVNLRQGPGIDYPTAWVFRRAGLPVEVIEEFESWRKVRDSDGTTGWIFSALLSGRRTALVLPWELKPDAPRPQVALRRSESSSAPAVALIEAGVIADVQSCDGKWCYVAIEDYRGYLEQVKLWGVYQRERVK